MPKNSTSRPRFINSWSGQNRNNHIGYNPSTNKVSVCMKYLGWAIILVGAICAFSFARMVTDDVFETTVFNQSVFFTWMLTSVSGGALFIALGEIISQLQAKNELTEINQVYLRKIDTKIDTGRKEKQPS